MLHVVKYVELPNVLPLCQDHHLLHLLMFCHVIQLLLTYDQLPADARTDHEHMECDDGDDVITADADDITPQKETDGQWLMRLLRRCRRAVGIASDAPVTEELLTSYVTNNR